MVPNGYTSERPGPYWSNPPFFNFDIGALGAQDWVPESPNVKNLKNGGLDQYGPERFGRLILLQSEKCGTERVNEIDEWFNLCRLARTQGPIVWSFRPYVKDALFTVCCDHWFWNMSIILKRHSVESSNSAEKWWSCVVRRKSDKQTNQRTDRATN